MPGVLGPGHRAEGDAPFGIVRQLFETAVATDGPRRWLKGRATLAACAFDVSVDGPPGGPDDDATAAYLFPADPPSTDRGRSLTVLHGLFWLVADRSTRSPTILVVDDVQWCDHPSLRFLAYLSRRVANLPVLVVMGWRTLNGSADGGLLAELALDPETVTLARAVLSEGAVRTLLTDRIAPEPDGALVATVHEMAGRNPLLLRELLRVAEAERRGDHRFDIGSITRLGSRAVARTVGLRLAQLEPAAAVVARAPPLLGGGSGVALVAQATGLDAADSQWPPTRSSRPRSCSPTAPGLCAPAGP